MSYDEAQLEIVKSFGLEDYPPEMQEAFLIQFGGVLFQALMLRGAEELPADATDAFDAIISNDPEPEDVFTFFEEHIPHFEKLVAEVVTQLKNRSEAITHEFLEELKEPSEE